MRLPVFVQDWQIECCLDPVSVGEQVRWRLDFVETAPARDRRTVELDVVAHPYGDPSATITDFDGSARFDIRLALTGTAGWLYWAAPRPVSGRIRLIGRITEDHHVRIPDTLPPTSGTVLGIEVEARRFQRDPPGSRMWIPSPDPPSYRQVTTSPRTFGRSDGFETAETGILVDLQLADVPAPSRAAASAANWSAPRRR
jgi:hypothetical protein